MTALRPLLVLAALALLAAPAFAAKTKPSLEPYAGSYTGMAVSSTAAGTLSSSATLTFTGRKNSLRGTFLYTGILNNAGQAQSVTQTVDIARSGTCSGRVTLGSSQGTCTGNVSMQGKALTFTITYQLGDASGTTVTLAGTVRFSGRRAAMIATVTSSDPGYSGTLTVKGKR
jgi:hypothetical protein